MFKNEYILIRNLATLIILCNILYWFFPFPPVVWRVALVLLSSFVIIFKEGRKTGCEKTVLLFVVLNLAYFIVSYLHINPSTTQIGNILCALLPLSLFVCLGKKDVMTDKFFVIVSIVFLVASVFSFYHAQAGALERIDNDSIMDVTVNATSKFLFLLPMVFLLKNDIQRLLVMGVIIFFLLMGAKRGNILAAVFPVVLIVWYMLKDSLHSVGKTVLVIAAMVVLGYFAYNWFLNNDYLMHRLEQTVEGNSSGRDVIYAHAWQAWSTSNSAVRYALGYGFDGIVHHPTMFGMHAHNDWLEILVDYGLIGIFSYLLIFISFAVLIARTKDLQTKMVLLSAVSIWFFKTLYSMGFTEGNMCMLMMSLGTAIGQSNFQNKRIES